MAPHYSRQCFADALSQAKREAYHPVRSCYGLTEVPLAAFRIRV